MMFSFFRRSKKDISETGGSLKEKKNREKECNKETNVPHLTVSKDMCKNNLTVEKVENAPEGVNVTELPNNNTKEFGLAKSFTSASAIVSGNEVVTNTNNETNDQTNYETSTETGEKLDKMDETFKGDSVKQAATSYANMLKSGTGREVKEIRIASVKPCGHGTIGITPRIPLPSSKKKENSCTPPESPKEDLKNKPFTKNIQDTSNAVCVKSGSSLNGNSDENLNDTVTGIMKLRVDLPVVSPSPPPTNVTTPPWRRNSLRTLNENTNIDAKTKNLINQEAKFQSQLNDLSKTLSIRDAEVNKLQFQMDELQRDVFAKAAGMDRLQAELQAAHKESETARQKLKHLEHNLAEYKRKNSDLTEELQNKAECFANYEKEAKAKIAQLEETIKNLQSKICSLETQIETLKQEKEHLEEQEKKLIAERDEEKDKLQKVINKATEEKESLDKKWNNDFEKMRTINIVKEQQLLEDFEWKLREVHQSCKKKLDEKEKKNEEQLQKAYKCANERLKEAENKLKEVERLKSYEAEVRQLRGLTNDQENSIKLMLEKQEEMKASEEILKQETQKLRTLIEMEKENLQHIQRLHNQDSLDRERKLQQTLAIKKTEIAVYWEERLLSECGRLKSELEQLHNEEKHLAIETVKKEKNEEFYKAKKNWEKQINECLKEINMLKNSLKEKDEYYHEEVIKAQTKTDTDLLELRRVMDKIDMMHHEKFEKLVNQHEEEIEKINEETERRLKEVETIWQNQVTSLRTTLELVKEQMERESQQKIENLIEQHRSELDAQWENLIHQKSEAVKLVEEEYLTKYRTLEEQFLTQQKSHAAREVELLKAIDTLKNEVESKGSMLDDLQNNVDTLEGGVQVLNQEIAHQGVELNKTKRDADQKIRGLQEMLVKAHKQLECEREAFKQEISEKQKQAHATIDQLQRKCQCLTKLFEEIRTRYDRRESRQEDLNLIADLRQVIAEQEKDLTCINEEKRFYQIKLMNLERSLEEKECNESKDFESPEKQISKDPSPEEVSIGIKNGFPQHPMFLPPVNCPINTFSIPPTIPECDDCDE